MSPSIDYISLLKEAYEEMHRFFANPETYEQAFERRQYIFDLKLIMGATKAEYKAESIVYTLGRRFRVVPEEMQTKLLAVTDVAFLDRLMALSFDCHSLEEFVTQLR